MESSFPREEARKIELIQKISHKATLRDLENMLVYVNEKKEDDEHTTKRDVL